VAGLAVEMPVRAVAMSPVPPAVKRLRQALTLASPRAYCCREIHSKTMQAAIDELCRGTRFDLIQLESSLLCAFRLPHHIPVIIDEHNIEYEVFQRLWEGERSLARRAFNRSEYARFRRFEQRCWRRADGCAVTSEREVETVRTCAPATPVAVVPNAVDLQYFAPSPARAAAPSLVFNGTLDYRPNLDAARYLLEEIWPLVHRRHPEATLTLIGRSSGVDLRPLRRPGVRLLGEVPDIRPHLRAAAAVVAPIRMGGGTRLKVLEALAMAKPVISTTIGCEGVAVRDGEHLLIADEAATFAARISTVFENPNLAEALGRAGRRLIEAGYSWERAGERLDSLLQAVAGSHPLTPSNAPFTLAEV